MRDFNKFGPFGCGRVKAALRFSLSVSSAALMLGGMGGGLLFVCGEAQAAICFLPDCVEKPVGSSDPSGRICRSDGYLPNGEIVCSEFSYVEYCPEDASYLKCNNQKWCGDNGYTVLAEDCTVPEYADEQCPNGLALYKRCKADYERACEEEDGDYVSECQDGWKLDDEELCSYSPLYGKCCNECLDYPYKADEIPSGYHQGKSCSSCDGVRYQKELNDCAADGFIRCDKGGQTGTEVCLSGSEKWYKECCSECSGYPYFENEIPEGYLKGDSCDSCDGMKYKTKVGACAEGYNWENNACVVACKQTCDIGNILYSDSTCSSCKVSGKTPIGVVSYAEGTKRLAINLTTTSAMTWSSSYTDISGIPNYSSSPHTTDFNGKSNTAAWVSYYGSSVTNYAPGYCYNFTTTGTSKGQWYLPAAGELYASVWTNKSTVSAGLSAVGGRSFQNGWHWSSSERGTNHAWLVAAYNGDVDWGYKHHSRSVRCVLPFEDNGGGTAKVCTADYKYTCAFDSSTHISGGSGSACAGTYKSCTCQSGYEWKDGACAQNCVVGSILNSDMSCTSTKVSGKTPIGVVSYINGRKRIAINLTTTGVMYWSSNYVDISGIPNYSSSPHTIDFNGKSNTAAWVSHYGSSVTNYAPGYCYNFTTTGTSKGQWYLPAQGELYASVWTNKSAVNAGLRAAGGTSIQGGYHWSSSEDYTYGHTGDAAWNVYAYDGNVSNGNKNGYGYVRCVLPFEDNGGGTAKVCTADYKYTCAFDSSTHISGGSGSACAGTYKSCTCQSGYEWKDGACVQSCDNTCSVGNILYSDSTCSSRKVSGKTPIGVVSYVNGCKGIAINLTTTDTMYWSSRYTDISGIPNYSSSPDTTDFNGKSNTAAWVSYYGSSVTNYAPGYCYNFTTTGTSKGQWYLPAQGELYASVWTNKSAVNAGLSAAGGASIQNGWHWSSSEGDHGYSGYAWNVDASNGHMSWYGKDYTYRYVRCVLAF